MTTVAADGVDRVAGRILVVDDEPYICRTLERFLVRLGHEVSTAGSVPDAIEQLMQAPFDLVLTDLRLPGPSGLDLLIEVRSRSPGTRMILMSANADLPSAALGIERGIDQLVLKPFDLQELRGQVEDSLARGRAARAAERERESLTARLRARETESRIWVLRAAHALNAAVEAKDAYTAGHATRVTTYAMPIAEVIGGFDLLRFRLAGDLHDVGKIGVPDSVLNKPGCLDEAEMTQVQRHPEIGENILRPLIDDPLVLQVVRSHHERWDGRGYPDGTARERIPLPARVLAVADTLDAMTSRRAYRDGQSWEAALAEIRRCSETQFDPGVVAAFEQALPRLTEQYENFRRRGVRGGLLP
ncbi:response regulator [soil metagenome]